MNILIVENDPLTVIDITEKLGTLGYNKIDHTDNVDDALSKIDHTTPDIVLVDIELNGDKDGIELGEKLNQKNIPFIYLSELQDTDTFERAKKTYPSSNLPKPFLAIHLRNSISHALSNHAMQSTNKHIVVPFKSKKQLLVPEQVIYLKAASNNCEIYLEDGSRILSSTPMGNVIAKLGTHLFCQVHRSYAVNLNKIKSFEGGRIFMRTQKGAKEIAIGKKFIDQFKSNFEAI